MAQSEGAGYAGVPALTAPSRSILDANVGDQMARRLPGMVMASPDEVQHLMPITIAASRIEPLLIAAAFNDSGDLGQMIFCAVIPACKANIQLDPYLPRLAEMKNGAEVCRRCGVQLDYHCFSTRSLGAVGFTPAHCCSNRQPLTLPCAI